MSHEMVERVAKHLRDEMPDCTPDDFAELIVRAVLVVLRDPPDDVIDAGKRVMDTFAAKDQVMGAALGDVRAVKMRLRWNAMIDWMLK